MHALQRVFIGCFVVLVLLLARERALLPEGNMKAVFLNVGQGDSTLITFRDGSRMLIDGGPDWTTLEALGKRLPFFDRTIDIVMLSHPNTDHMTSLPEVIRRYHVRTLITAGTDNANGLYRSMLSGAELQKVRHTIVKAGDRLKVDTAEIEVLWPPATRPAGMDKDQNNDSIVCNVREGGKSILLTGDAEAIVEKTLLASGADIDADILKVGHHGSSTSTTDVFLRAVSPSIAIISAGKNNPFGHPTPAVLSRLKAFGTAIQRTDEQGDITIVW